MNVLDASAILAFLQDEEGAELVEIELVKGAAIGTANWSEVMQKVRQHGRGWDQARALLLSYEPDLEPVTIDDAEWAAERWRSGAGLSLADRLCLALGARLETSVLTADTRWGVGNGVSQLR